jgi:penicillin-binding protein 1A
MMMAVASDLPSLDNEKQYNGPTPRNSVLQDSQGRTIGRLASNQNRIYVKYEEISRTCARPSSRSRTSASTTNSGVDLRGIARAFVQDVIKGGAVQGGSTITQQFVKNAIEGAEQAHRLPEAARGRARLPPHPQVGQGEDPQEYLNSIYFGNGAYGIESAAARTSARPTSVTAAPPRSRARTSSARPVGAAGRDHRVAERL